MDLIVMLIVGILVTVLGGLGLDLVRGAPGRTKARLARALSEIPDEAQRERWREELEGVLEEAQGRPLKQRREGRQLVRAAEGIAASRLGRLAWSMPSPLEIPCRPALTPEIRAPLTSSRRLRN